MPVEIRRFDPSDQDLLWRYADVPQSFEVRSIFRVSNAGSQNSLSISLNEVEVEEPWIKDYRADEDEVLSMQRFVCAHNSAFFVALDDGAAVGGAAGIRHCLDAEFFCMTNGRPDVAVLNDIRITQSHQGLGIGRQLVDAVVDWCRNEQMRYLKIETQNTNVPACRFYQRMGAKLGGIQQHVYDGENADEAMLLWYLEL